ncbi:MAG TPA: hypothetical protein VGN57_03155 [Pirellulaceae bacterium]|jgi:hypothetical protein|nr:hypothetical protein [Pirellulaceae bacterium]
MITIDVELEDAAAIEADAAAESARVVEKRRRRWGCLLYAGLAILIPTLVLFCVWLWFHVADRRLAEEALARARAAGDPLTTAEMQALFYPPSPAIDEATAHWIEAAERTREAKKKVVAEKLAYVGAYGVKAELDEDGFYAESTLKLVDESLEGAGEGAIEAAHAARRAGSVARFASDVPTHEKVIEGFEIPQALRDLQMLLLLDAERAAARGELDRATDDLCSLVAVSEAFADIATPYGKGVHAATFGVAYMSARELIDRVDFTDEQLRRIDAAFATPDFQRGLVRILQADQYRIVRAVETDEPTGDETLEVARWFPFRGADEALAIELCQDLLDAAKIDLIAAEQAKARLESRHAEFNRATNVENLRYAVTILTTYELVRYVNMVLRSAAERDLVRTGIACERHRLKYGVWPESLEALVPEFLAEVPIDVYDGQPMRFETDGDRLALHSIGQLDERYENVEFDDGPLTFVIEKPQRP